MGDNRFSLTIQADVNNLAEVKEFINDKLDMTDCSKKIKMNIAVSVEEIFMNVCSYAYIPDTGNVVLEFEFGKNKESVYITFVDKGVSYNPLQDNELDVENHIKKRQVGGLGIFMTKKLMDKMTYEYRNNENRLTLFKCLK